MFTKAFESIESSTEIKEKILNTPTLTLFGRSLGAGAVVGLGVVALCVPGTYLVHSSPAYLPLLVAISFALALVLKVKVGVNLFTNMALVLPITTMRGNCGLKKFARVMLTCVAGNLAGTALVAYVGYLAGVFVDESLIDVIAARKIHASGLSLFGQAVLCSWALTLGAWSWFHVATLGRRLAIVAACLFFFLCSGYEHAVANVTFLMLANLLPHGVDITWSDMLWNLLPVALGNLVSGVVVSVAGYATLRTSMERTSYMVTLPQDEPVAVTR